MGITGELIFCKPSTKHTRLKKCLRNFYTGYIENKHFESTALCTTNPNKVTKYELFKINLVIIFVFILINRRVIDQIINTRDFFLKNTLC